MSYSSAIKKSREIIFGRRKSWYITTIFMPENDHVCVCVCVCVCVLVYNKSLKAQEVKLTTVIT